MASLSLTRRRLACAVVAGLLGCVASDALAQTADILWRNTKTGENAIWKRGDYRVRQPVAAAPINWEVVGTARSSFNGAVNVIWRNKVDGRAAAWPGAEAEYGFVLPRDRYKRWTFAGTGYFDTSTHLVDILWRDVSGHNMIWRFGSTPTLLSTSLTTVTNLDWKVAGIGDFDGDMYSDILWRNVANGSNVIWLHGSELHPWAVPAVTNLAWQIVGVGDFDGDGHADILWRESTTGRNAVWNWGRAGSYARALPIVPALSWKVVGIGDFNSDGRSDVLWRDSASGRNVIWAGADATQIIPVARVPDQAWVVAAVGDFTDHVW